MGLPAAGDANEPGVARLLIGDKVVTDAPSDDDYPHQLDLGGAWHDLTGRPFVFAVWLARADAELGDLPDRLAALVDRNLDRIDAIAAAYAPAHGWSPELATEYLGRILRYRVGEPELDAIRQFAERAARLGLTDAPPRALTTLGSNPEASAADRETDTTRA